jgi:DNA-binding CsgD family transcriptional regulator
MLDAAVSEAFMAARFDVARGLAGRLVALCRDAGNRVRLSAALCRLATVAWHLGDGTDAQQAADEAVEVLADGASGGVAFGEAYAVQARLAMLDHRPDEAVAWGEKAAVQYETSGAPVPTDLLVTIGTAAVQRDPDDPRLAAALRTAVAGNEEYPAARAYCNLAGELTIHRRYREAGPVIDDGLAYLDGHHDIVGWFHLLAVRAQWHADQGRWSEAERDAASVLRGTRGPSAVMAKVTLGTVQVRRGDPAAAVAIGEAHLLAVRANEAQHLIPASLARAELAWLGGEADEVLATLEPVRTELARAGMVAWAGAAALLLHRAGRRDVLTRCAGRPFTLQIAGDWREAAAQWHRLGCPYEEADALADSPDPEALREALTILDRLGAEPRAAMVRRRLVEMGEESVPRGPRPQTRANPAGLTARQSEVLGLLAAGLTYREIAQRLHLSVKTVDHHATAVRDKLGASSRSEAVAAARRLGVVARDD